MLFLLCDRKQLPAPQDRRSGVKGVKSRVAVWFKRHKEILHAHSFTALAMDDRVMPALLFLCSILHLFHGFKAASLPRDRSSVSNYLQASQSMPLLQPLSPLSPLILLFFGPYLLFTWWLMVVHGGYWWLMVVNGGCVPSSKVLPTLLEQFLLLKSNIFFVVKLPL